MDKERSSLGRLGYSEFKDLIVSLKMWQVCPDHVLHGDHFDHVVHDDHFDHVVHDDHFDHVVHDDHARECSGRTPRRRRGCCGLRGSETLCSR